MRHAARVRKHLRAPPRGQGIAMAGAVTLHAVLGVVLFAVPHIPPPAVLAVYRVELVAAPQPEPRARPAPQAVERPAERPPPAPRGPRRTSVAEAPPPLPPEPQVDREPAPRTTPDAEPLPGEAPSTGSDEQTVKVEGQQFPYPEYLRNIVAQIHRRWQRPAGNVALRAEVFFLIHRDGSISNLRFVARSGRFAFDLEAQGAIEAAGNVGGFGPLPDGYENDVLPVSFFFDPRKGR